MISFTKITKTENTLSNEVEEVLSKLATTSAKIKYLKKEGLSVGDIARVLNIRYQHARNVLITPVKKPR